MTQSLRPRSARQRAAYADLTATVAVIDAELSPEAIRLRLPDEWHLVSDDPVAAKDKITICVDRDVLKFFRAFGRGYQSRMNRVLRSFVLARLTGLADGPDTRPIPGEFCPTCRRDGLAADDARPLDLAVAREAITARLNALRAACEAEGDG